MNDKENTVHINVRISDSNLVELFESYVERRLRFALGRFGGRVRDVTVRIARRSRAEYRCRISTHALPFGRVAVEETDLDLFAAVDRATGRIGRLFGRELERGRNRMGRDSIRLAA
jgi:putative sigma-54 modulation protein